VRETPAGDSRNGRLDMALEARVGEPVENWQRLLSDVFDRFPYGIAIAGRGGVIIACNEALQEFLRLDGDRLAGATCCEVLGCRRPGERLPESCLTETAIGAPTGRSEVLLTPPSAARPLCVTAARLYPDGSHVIFHVRPAGTAEPPSDDPEGSSTRRLRLHTLGRTRLETPQGAVAGDWLDQRTGQLLKFLVCERRRVVPIDEIAEAVWPNPRPATLSTVRYFVHALRDKLEPDRPRRARASLVQARRGGYTIDDHRLWIDADEFEAKVHDGLAALAHGDRLTATDLLEQALNLYAGDFLADEPYAEWAHRERERLRALAERPLYTLAELHADDPAAAVGYLERLADMEPFDSEIQRQLLTLWTSLGQRSRAVRHYHAFRRRMLRAFGEQPSFSLTDLLR
jgi:DNA-binding SARP family transcriptional activator